LDEKILNKSKNCRRKTSEYQIGNINRIEFMMIDEALATIFRRVTARRGRWGAVGLTASWVAQPGGYVAAAFRATMAL
jgi:hypothetical protein